MKNVLIVEDDDLVMKMYAKKFVDEGFIVNQAVNGKEGLKVALEKKPDIILLDIHMPVMTGLEMLAELRADSWGKNVPVIILTNLEANNQITWDVAKTEPAYYLMKAENRPDMVIEKVNEILNEIRS